MLVILYYYSIITIVTSLPSIEKLEWLSKSLWPPCWVMEWITTSLTSGSRSKLSTHLGGAPVPLHFPLQVPIEPCWELLRAAGYSVLVYFNVCITGEIYIRGNNIRVCSWNNSEWSMPWSWEFSHSPCFLMWKLYKYPLTNLKCIKFSFPVTTLLILTLCLLDLWRSKGSSWWQHTQKMPCSQHLTAKMMASHQCSHEVCFCMPR